MRDNASPFAGLPLVVKNLLIINVIFFLVKITGLGNFGGADMDTLFGLHYFASPLFKPWQLVTHMFMHGGFGHLFLNMIGLFMLGPPLEYRWGSERFLSFYMLTGVGAALFYSGAHAFDYYALKDLLSPDQLAEVQVRGPAMWNERLSFGDPYMDYLNRLFNIPMVGASGAIYGVLLAFGMIYPNVELIMFPIFIPIKAKYFVMILGGISIYSALQSNPNDNVAHLAHLGGMIVGYLLIRLWRHRDQSSNPWR
jgi:membrane associated rhomboid family serine protease